MIKERRSDDILLKRIDKLESGHKDLKDAIDYNSNLTNVGFDNINIQLGEMKELMGFYQSTKNGTKFLAWLGGALISIGTLWVLIRDVFLHTK